ncbi:hypothetical protein [Streptacidiphilus sp. P02-A3a]|uniref:hypothetical protein n=1 Tax=Streptacidiphilus sp. P02-A3a TaxID=2704468 RepID=UPI0015FD1575|nr:hypothetical protein [Streptacidiphilus sp. P02-A3a]QMU71705.1 hypothetical protein GXP74_29130 [Streptacidiphilus sp. P02-A3a]
MESAGHGMETFLGDIALCLSVSRGTSPALVWPRGCEAVLGRLTPFGRRAARLTTEAEALAARWESAASTRELTSGLRVSLGTGVDAAFQPVRTGTSGGPLCAESDQLLLPVHGGCRIDVAPPRDRPVRPPADRPLSLRLRVGGAFYVPAGFTATPHQAPTSCVLLVLRLRADGEPDNPPEHGI